MQGTQRAHLELYIRDLAQTGLMASSVNTMMHAVRGFFRFAHIDGLIVADLAVYARLPKIHGHESRTQGLDRLELIRFFRSPKPSASTTPPSPTFSVLAPCAPPKPRPCGSRTTPKCCAATKSCT